MSRRESRSSRSDAAAPEDELAALVQLDDPEVDDRAVAIADALAEKERVEARGDRAAEPALDEAERRSLPTAGGAMSRQNDEARQGKETKLCP